MKHRSRTAFIVSFLAPAVLLYGLFVVWPLIQAFWLSMFRWRGVSQQKTYVGFENFSKLWNDDVFWKSLKNNLVMLAAGAIAVFVLGLLIAHAMQGGGRMAKALRSIVLFPQVISLVAVAILWGFMYNPSYGLVTSALQGLGAGDWAKNILGDSKTALPAVTIAFLWYAVGFYIMLFSTGLSGISSDVMEAAELDGSHGMHRFWRITWPMLFSAKRTAAIYIVINVMNVFALVWLMTHGGPDRATEVMLTNLYQEAFVNSQFGYATALAVANFIVAMGLAVILMFFFRRSPEEARA